MTGRRMNGIDWFLLIAAIPVGLIAFPLIYLGAFVVYPTLFTVFDFFFGEPTL
jgi:hypothetical protein